MTANKPKDCPPVEYLRECFDYNQSDGSLIWKERPVEHFFDSKACKIWNKRFSGTLAGRVSKSKTGKSYRQVTICRLLYLNHRIVYSLHNGNIETSLQVDHINGNGLDNRIENLRLVTGSDNLKNSRLHKNNTSGVTGVSWNSERSKWLASIKTNNKVVFLGWHEDFESAVNSRRMAEKKYGFHDNHGSNRPL